MKRSKTVIGITGDIGAGKSTVSNYLIDRGYYVIDADIVAREVAEDKYIQEQLDLSFPGVIKNGVLDRKALGEIVFSDKRELAKLNAIMHPEIIKRIKYSARCIDKAHVFIDAALLFEVGLDSICDKILYVEMDTELRLDRVVSRDNISRTLAMKKIESFSNTEYKKSKSIIISNNGSLDDLYKKIDDLLDELTK